jgi:hypothetical protein
MRFVKMLSLIMTEQLRSAVFGSIGQYEEFFKQYDFDPWEEAARAGHPDDLAPDDWCDAPAEKSGECFDANIYWRR